jgi:hypothetical protein
VSRKRYAVFTGAGCLDSHPPRDHTMALYVVRVAGPQKTWIDWDQNRNLPAFTFIQPEGISREEAKALKARANICCGGTLKIVKAPTAA